MPSASMFDLLTYQKRERLLIIAACVVLCGIVMMVLPAMFDETNRQKNIRQQLIKDIEEYEKQAKNKTEIQDRLTTFANQALAASGDASSRYRTWLENLIINVGLKYQSSTAPVASSLKDIYTKYTFTLVGTGKLDQIAEFLRRFHRTAYLHLIQNISYRPSTKNPGEFEVTFKIEALALRQGRLTKVPSTDNEAAVITDDETTMLATIRDRAILSEYLPPKPVESPPPTPPQIDFDDTLYCIVYGIVEVDGKPQCWIDYRTEGKKYYLFEEESFKLGEVNCTIKKIEVNVNRVQIAAAGGVYAVRLGKAFAQPDATHYFLTDIVDADGKPWMAGNTGKPYGVIVHGTESEDGRLRAKEKHILSEGDSFPMANVLCTVRQVEPATQQIQIEAAGVVYPIRVGGSFSEFEAE